MIDRNATARVRAALRVRPVVLLHGARQTGKTTLVRRLAREDAAAYVTLDDLTTLAAAEADPQGFVDGLPPAVVIDEVQRVPNLLLAIKTAVDRHRKPGRFLLTGSANVLQIPRVSDSLVGRMEVVTLWPLAQAEIEGTTANFIDAAFSPRVPTAPPPARQRRSLIERILRGGFPEAVLTRNAAERSRWFDAYLTTIIRRDARDLARIAGAADLTRLLTLVATRSATTLNVSDSGRALGMTHMTTRRYLTLLATMFLVHPIPPWSANIGKRLVKSPKVYAGDTGLAAHLMGIDAARLAVDPSLLGGLMETFVVMELVKLADGSTARPAMYHYRTQGGEEVDVVLERPSGSLVGIEIKSSATLGAADARGLRALADATGRRFHRGIILYTGTETVPFAKNIFAVPVAALWSR